MPERLRALRRAAVLAIVVPILFGAGTASAADGSLAAGAVFLPSEGVDPELAGDLSEVLAASLESDGAAEVMPKERFQLVLREEGGGSVAACATDAECVRRAGARAGRDFVVVARAERAAGGFRLTLTRHSVGVGIVRVLTYDLDEKLGQLAASLDAARSELLRPEGALLVVEANVEDASVLLDGVLLGETPLAPREIVAGEHRVTVRSIGYVPFDETVRCAAAAPCRVTVQLELEPLPEVARPAPVPPPAPRPAPPSPSPERPMSTQRILAWSSVGLSVASLAAGTGFAVGAWQKEDELGARCDEGTRVCTISRARAESLRDDGELYATLSNVFYGVAGAAAVTAVVLFVFEPDAEPASVEVLPQASGDSVGVGATLRF